MVRGRESGVRSGWRRVCQRFFDTGECHHTRNTRKHTGRIYKITYGKPKPWRGDIGKLKTEELAALQLHDNDWFVRHARRVLHERLDYTHKIWSPASPDPEKTTRLAVVP